MREYARLSRLKFENGAASYVDVLYAENELFVAEPAATGTAADCLIQVVNIYRALGGGWVDAVDAEKAAEEAKRAPQSWTVMPVLIMAMGCYLPLASSARPICNERAFTREPVRVSLPFVIHSRKMATLHCVVRSVSMGSSLRRHCSANRYIVRLAETRTCFKTCSCKT